MPRKAIAAEALIDLRRRLGTFPPRSPERRRILQETAALYGVSEPTLYRLLRQRSHLRALGRSDRGVPRVLPPAELERYLELIAASERSLLRRQCEPDRIVERMGGHTPIVAAARMNDGYASHRRFAYAAAWRSRTAGKSTGTSNATLT